MLVEQLERVRTEVQDLMGQRGALEGRGRALEAELGQAQEALAHKHAECEQLVGAAVGRAAAAIPAPAAQGVVGDPLVCE